MKRLFLSFIILLLAGNGWATTWFQCDGNTFCGASISNYWGTVDLASGQNSPVGSTNVWRWTAPTGVPGGEGIANVWLPSLPGGTSEFWLQYWFKYSPGFDTGVVAKQFYIHQPSNTMAVGMRIDKGIDMVPQGAHVDNHWPNVNTSTWYRPQESSAWHKFKGHYTLGSQDYNGSYEAWVDDVKISSYQGNVWYDQGSTYFNSPAFVVIIAATVPSTEYFYVAGIYMGSTDPGGAGAGDVTPPYTDTFSPSNGATGVLVGTTSASFHFKDSGTGAAGADSSSLTIACTSPSIATKHCGDTPFACTGTSADYTATLSGLSLSYDQVVSCTINGQDLASPPNVMAQQSYSFTVQANPLPTLTITTTSPLAGATVGDTASQTLTATGGSSPYSWDISAGSLPPGRTLSPSGVISGTYTTSGTYNFTARVTDTQPATATKAFSQVVSPAPGVIKQNQNFADTFIGGGDDVNWSTSTELRTYQWPAGVKANIIIIFDNVDILSIPDNAVINSATLKLRLTGYDGSGGTNPMRVYVYRITGTLPDTTTVTWNNFAGTLQPYESVTEVSKTSGYFSWTVTEAVKAAYAARTPLYLALDGSQDGAQDTNRIFASVDHATTAWRPQLIVNYQAPINIIPPSAPTGHSVSAGDTQVTLNPGSSVGAVSYNAYWTSDGSAPSKTNGTKIVGVTNGYVLSSLTNGTLYKFVFTATNADGESVVNPVVSATPIAPPDPPAVPDATSYSAVTALAASVVIYPGSSPGATSYNAYYTSDGSTPSKSAYGVKITGATNASTITGLTNGVTYKFVFTAVNATGESVESAVISATPAAASSVNYLINMGNALINAIGSGMRNYLK